MPECEKIWIDWSERMEAYASGQIKGVDVETKGV